MLLALFISSIILSKVILNISSFFISPGRDGTLPLHLYGLANDGRANAIRPYNVCN